MGTEGHWVRVGGWLAGWLLVAVASAFGAMIGLIAAAGSLEMIPAEGCDSECRQNDTLLRVLGFVGIPLALAAAVVVPVAAWLGKTRPGTAALLVLGVTLSMTAWWIGTQHLLDSAVST